LRIQAGRSILKLVVSPAPRVKGGPALAFKK